MSSHHNMQHANHPFNEPPKEGDIATERYQGPSARVAAAGQGFLEHFFFAFAGLIGAGIVGFIFHKPTATFIQGARSMGTRLKEWSPEGSGIINRSKDTVTNWIGSALHGVFGNEELAQSIESLSHNSQHPELERLKNLAHDKRQGFGNMLLSHTFGALPIVGMRFKQMLRGLGERWATAISFGGAAGLVGYVTGWTKALIHGAKHGNAGKRQFERAQEEIKHLREVNEDLEKVNDRLHSEIVTAETKFKDGAEGKSSDDKTEKKPHTQPLPDAAAAKTEHISNAEHALHHEAKTEHHAAAHPTHSEHAHNSHEHTAHHGDKPSMQTHAHSHQGTVNGHAHEPAMA